MSLRPILASFRHHRLTVTLLVLQVAFTCAIVCNACFLIVQRVQRISVDSGLDERSLSVVSINDLSVGGNALSVHQGDLQRLRSIPGVESAAIVDLLPLWGGQDATGVCGSLDAVHAVLAAHTLDVPGCAMPAEFSGGPDVVRTLGLHIVEGRAFRSDEFVTGKPGYVVGYASGVIISQALARRLFPGPSAVGRSIYYGKAGFSGHGTVVVGVVDHLQRGLFGKPADADQSMLVPSLPNDAEAVFVLRSRPQDRATVLAKAVARLKANHADREMPDDAARTYTQVRRAFFQRDATMIGLLVASALGLLFVTALGIAGLANFWVQQRTRTIGIRRAIGATRGDILRYFQTENLLIVSGGIVLGMVMAVLLNLLLMRRYELPRLPLFYLPWGALALWVLGQLSVLAPALRASRVPPVVATRSV